MIWCNRCVKHKWQEHGVRDKKCFTLDLFWNWQMIIWTFRIQKLKIGSLADFEKKSFSSLFLMRKPLSSDQECFLRPYFPLIGGIFVLKSGLRFLFRALEVPIRKVRKSPFFSWNAISAKFLTFLHQHFFRAPPSPVVIVCSRGCLWEMSVFVCLHVNVFMFVYLCAPQCMYDRCKWVCGVCTFLSFDPLSFRRVTSGVV